MTSYVIMPPTMASEDRQRDCLHPPRLFFGYGRLGIPGPRLPIEDCAADQCQEQGTHSDEWLGHWFSPPFGADGECRGDNLEALKHFTGNIRAGPVLTSTIRRTGRLLAPSMLGVGLLPARSASRSSMAFHSEPP